MARLHTRVWTDAWIIALQACGPDSMWVTRRINGSQSVNYVIRLSEPGWIQQPGGLAIAGSHDGTRMLHGSNGDLVMSCQFTVTGDTGARLFCGGLDFMNDSIYDGRRAKWAPNDLLIVVLGGHVKHHVCLATPTLGGHWDFELWSACPPDEQVRAVAWSPDSTLLAVATDAVHGDRIHIWQISPRKLVRTLVNDVYPAVRTEICDLSWTADGKYLASTGIDVWHVASGKLVWTVIEPTRCPITFRNKMMTSCVDSIAWSPYVDVHGRYTMCVNEASSIELLRFSPASSIIELLRFSPASATLTSLYEYSSQLSRAGFYNALVWRRDGLCVFINTGHAIKELTAVPWSPRHHYAFTRTMRMYTCVLVTVMARHDWPRELVYMILEHLCVLL